MSRSIKLLVFLSFFFNLVFVGGVVGFALHHAMMGPPPWHLAPPPFLPEDKAERFFQAMEQTHRENRDTHQQMLASRRKLEEILAAPSFDEHAYDQEVAQLQELRLQIMQRLANTAKELAKGFTPEERRQLAHHLMAPPPPPPMHKQGKSPR